MKSIIPVNANIRGGVAVLVRNTLWPCVFDCTPELDQFWFRLSNFEGWYFGAVYIPPRDSSYFSPDSLSTVNEHLKSHNAHALVIGDFNARIAHLQSLDDLDYQISYSKNCDTGNNQNGTDLVTLCLENDLKVLNHLKFNETVFKGAPTFRRKTTWISQIDWIAVSRGALNAISNFDILDDVTLPTDHAALSVTVTNNRPLYDDLLERAIELGKEHYNDYSLTKRPLHMHNIDTAAWVRNLPEPENLWHSVDDINSFCTNVSSVLYEAAAKSTKTPSANTAPVAQNAMDRWQYLLQHGDSKQIWRAIGWNGCPQNDNSMTQQPSNADFCTHYEKLLNPQEHHVHTNYEPPTARYIPILDDPILPGELLDCINSLKLNKSAGLDGVPPGLLKFLTDDWLYLLTFMFNLVFDHAYPHEWLVSRVFNIFKKGCRLTPDNYRGISVLMCLPKLYDAVLSQRLRYWYSPMYEQAGAQPKRGCEEQILTLRLLIEIARKCRYPLYIAFIDYAKAYDKVDRTKMLKFLDKKGCGTKFLKAIQASYNGTCGQIGNDSFPCSAGVKQGAATSCPLFTAFIEPTIEAVKSFGNDGWLENVHIMLLMDDTVVVATSWERMSSKLDLLINSAEDIGMTINPQKSKFIAVNSDNRTTYRNGNICMSSTDTYTYLGTPISASPISKQVRDHLQAKSAHVLKFFSFLNKNRDAPFPIKRKVWESALQSTLFYACETWFSNDLRAAETVYSSTLKQMLGVRQTTCTDVVLIETGLSGAKAEIAQRQSNFLQKLIRRPGYPGSYIENIIRKAIDKRTAAGMVIKQFLDQPNQDWRSNSLMRLKEKIRCSSSSKRMTYMCINDELCVSQIYYSGTIDEVKRISFTRMRTSSHRLAIETGRWARLPRDRRLCPCGSVQTEEHVLLDCPLTSELRKNHFSNLPELFKNFVYAANLCNDIFSIFS